MSVATPPVRRTAAAPTPAEVSGQAPSALKVWASIGGILLAVELFFLAKWIVGDGFTAVDSGPDDPPGGMKAVFLGAQIILPIATVATFYWFLVRPWIKERRVSTDGLLCLAFLLAAPWDPLSTYGENWFSYNSYLVNMGSVVGELPGVMGYHEPGAGDAWSPLVIGTVYVAVFIWMAVLICGWLRKIKARHPHFGPVRIIVCCFGITMLADVVIEGILLAPLGFYQFGSGHWAINGGHYYKFPLHEMIFGGAVFASFICLRYFINDRGETLAERGADKLNGTPAKRDGMRALAIIGAVHVGFLVCYHLPTAVVALNPTEYPTDTKNRSYFTNNFCGPDINRACPGPDTPLSSPGKPYKSWAGKLVNPPG